MLMVFEKRQAFAKGLLVTTPDVMPLRLETKALKTQ